MTSKDYHTPAMTEECMNALKIEAGGVYVDATYGGGGHARELLRRLGKHGALVAFDQDPDVQPGVIDDERMRFIPQNFRYIKNHLRAIEAIPVDGVLADLGVSSHQFDNPERGFSIRYDKPLDMRMTKTGELTAYRIVNEYPEEELRRVLKLYGEIHRPGKVINALVKFRENKPVDTTGKLIEILEPFATKPKTHKFYARVFQALRIEVNAELESLEALLMSSGEVLKKGGRLVVISYHSLEDRLVKNYMKHGRFAGGEPEKDFYGNPIKPFKAMPGKPMIPSEKEINSNPRSHSAKLRWAEKL